MSCININIPEFKALVEASGMNPYILAAKVGVWQEVNDSDAIPSLLELEIEPKRKEEVIDVPFIKSGVSELFESNPELAEIGTEQQYSEYLNTIFPDSKVKDIVYHGTKGERFEKFVENLESTERQGFFFTRDKNAAYSIKGGNVLQVLLDVKNLEFIPQKDRAEFRNIGSPKNILKEAGFDAVEIEGFAEGTEINIFEPEQIHILGSKQDIQGFKEFVDSQITTNNENFRNIVDDNFADWTSEDNESEDPFMC